MTDDGTVTTGTRLKNLEDTSTRILEQVSELNARDRADHVRLGNLTDRVVAVEGSITWLWRTVVGAVIAAAVAYLASR